MGAVTWALLIFISLPEAALNLWVFHLLMHGKDNLVPNKDKAYGEVKVEEKQAYVRGGQP